VASYEKNKSSGLWSVRFRETLPDGTVHQRRLSDGFKTKRDAQYAYEDYLRSEKERKEAAKLASQTDSNQLLFDEMLAKFYDYERPRLQPGSFYDMQGKFRTRIAPFFSGKKLSEITAATVLEWQNTLSKYSYKYKKNLHTYLVTFYNFAERYHDVKNIMKNVDHPRNLEGKKKMLFWTPEEFSKVLKEVEGIDYSMLYKFLYFSGCRRGEAAALTWEDIDFKRGVVNISKSADYKAGTGNKPYSIKTTKTDSSNRTVTLPPSFISELKEYRQWQKDNRPSTNFVFGAEDPLPPTCIDRKLKNATHRAGVKQIRVHDLRHSCASLLIHKGVTIVAVSHHLGHKSVKETLDTYSHFLPDDCSMIIEALSSVKL